MVIHYNPSNHKVEVRKVH